MSGFMSDKRKIFPFRVSKWLRTAYPRQSVGVLSDSQENWTVCGFLSLRKCAPWTSDKSRRVVMIERNAPTVTAPILIRGCGDMACRSPDVTNVTSHSSLALSVLGEANKNSLLLHWEPFPSRQWKIPLNLRIEIARKWISLCDHKGGSSARILQTADGSQIVFKSAFGNRESLCDAKYCIR